MYSANVCVTFKQNNVFVLGSLQNENMQHDRSLWKALRGVLIQSEWMCNMTGTHSFVLSSENSCFVFEMFGMSKNISFWVISSVKNYLAHSSVPYLSIFTYTITILHHCISDFQKYSFLLLNVYMHVLYYFIYIFINQINSRYTQLKAVEWNQMKWALTSKLEMYVRSQVCTFH